MINPLLRVIFRRGRRGEALFDLPPTGVLDVGGALGGRVDNHGRGHTPPGRGIEGVLRVQDQRVWSQIHYPAAIERHDRYLLVAVGLVGKGDAITPR